MVKKIRIADLPEFDFSEHLDSDEAIAQYLTAILEEGDPGVLAAALGDVARARGMSDIAQACGLTREALYKALKPGARPRLDTVARVCKALGLQVTVTPRVAIPARPRAKTAKTKRARVGAHT